MDNFRRRTRDNRRQTIDSILNAPTRSPQAQPLRRGERSVQFEGFRPTSGRRVDDFRRSEGYHATQTTGVRSGPITPHIPTKKEQQASLLHMTLPASGALGASKVKKEKHKAKDHSKQGRWRTFRKWSLRTALVLTALTLIVGGFLVFKGILKLNKVFKGGGAAAALDGDVKPELLKGEGDGRVNIILFGKGGETIMTWSSGGTRGFVEDLTNAELASTDLRYRDMRGVNLTNANLGATAMTGINFTGANLTNTNLEGAEGFFINFSGANLTGSELSFAHFRESNLANHDLSSRSFLGATFYGSDFTNTDISDSTFEGTDFSNGATFTNTNFTNAEFTDVNFEGSDLSGATLTGATWSNVTCPDGTNSNDNSNSCAGHLTP